MKTLVINTSGRKSGHTAEELKKICTAFDAAETEYVDAGSMKLNGCMTCDYCMSHDGVCVQKDDMPALLDKMISADKIIFGTPVYYWMISAQLKAIIDRCYSNEEKMKNKEIGFVITGAAGLDDPQYDAIKYQLEQISGYFSWKITTYQVVPN